MAGTAQKLGDWLAAVEGRAFDWQGWNCGHFAASWVLYATGYAPGLGLPAVDCPRTWARQLAKAGGLKVHMLRHTGARALPGFLAQVGDVVLLPGRLVPDGLGVCAGERVACVGPNGVAWLPAIDARHCWRLPDLVARVRATAEALA